MKFNTQALSKATSRNASRLALKLRKVSPEIGMVVGTISVVVGVVQACKASTKLEQVLEPTKKQLNDIHQAMEDPESLGLSVDDYDEKDARHDLFITYTKQAWAVTKLYAAPTVAVVFGIGCFYGSHHIMAKRNAALAAAFATVDKSFKEYRGRVISKFGKEIDRELRYDVKTQTVEKKVVDEKGKTKTVKEQVDYVLDDPSTLSEYSRFFDSSCKEWEDDSEYNMMYLLSVQSRFNDKLKSKGHVFLNEIYEAIGFPKTKAGQIVGWTYDPETCHSKTVDENGEPIGDDYIDFDIFNTRRPNARFVNGYEPVVLLDFNVEGNILDLI